MPQHRHRGEMFLTCMIPGNNETATSEITISASPRRGISNGKFERPFPIAGNRVICRGTWCGVCMRFWMGQRLVMANGAIKRRGPGNVGKGLEEDGRGRKGAVHVGPALQA